MRKLYHRVLVFIRSSHVCWALCRGLGERLSPQEIKQALQAVECVPFTRPDGFQGGPPGRLTPFFGLP